MENFPNGTRLIEANLQPFNPVLTATDAVVQTLGLVAPAAPAAPAIPSRKARKAHKIAARKARNLRALAPKTPDSKAQGKRKGKLRLSASESEALAARHVAESAKQFDSARKAFRAWESSPLHRDAKVEVCRYFGVNVVKGFTRPLYTASYKTQREAVAAIAGVPFLKKSKSEASLKLTALVAKVLRLVDEGYKVLGVKKPKNDSGRKSLPALDKAVNTARKFLKDTDRKSRAAWLAKVTDLIVALDKAERSAKKTA